MNYAKNILTGIFAVAALVSASQSQALTVTIDGVSSPTLLSDAVDTCMTAGAGPHTINITADALPTADRAILIKQPITINGDADNDSIPCDILVDAATIRTTNDTGILGYKSYIEVQTPGTVLIKDLNIHPNEDGANAGAANGPVNSVSGIRFFRPVLSTDTGTYNLTNVGVSGSDSANNYLSLGTATDLFNQSGRKRWGGLIDNASEANYVKYAAVHFSDDAIGAGSVVSVLDHCEFGLSRGCALSITAANTTVQVLGGVFGHSSRDGVRIADGANVTVKGTLTDRVRIVRAANVSGTNAHSLEVVGTTTVVPLLEYIDVAGETTANGFAFRDGLVTLVNSVRSLGKFDETSPNNHAMFIAGANINVVDVKNSTIHGDGEPTGDPLGIQGTVVNPVKFTDTIFTSRFTTETIFIGATPAGIATFNNCCLTSDGLVGESMADPPITGNTSGLPEPGAVIESNCVYVSPQYMLTLADYDWSDAQGSGNPLNGAGNRNVLRPALTNPAYLTASSTGGRLTGGAGPDAAGIADWMMME